MTRVVPIFERVGELAHRNAEEQLRAQQEIEDWMSNATVREIVRVATAARAALRGSPWPPGTVRLDGPIRPAELAGLVRPEHLTAVAAVVSLHRSGWVREAAVVLLAATGDDPRVVPFLLLRADDVVDAIRRAATTAIEERITPSHAGAFARSLRIVRLLEGRLRGASGDLRARIDELLLRPACRDALVATSTHDPDPIARVAALSLRLRVEPAPSVLVAALRDRESRVQAWAAHRATSRYTSEAERQSLLPALAASPSPWSRLLGLRSAARLAPDDDAPIEAATLDPHGAVRYAAHRILRARHPERPFGHTREVALAALRDADVDRRSSRLVGALGCLSDVGLGIDAPLVARHLEDPRARVRREAARTHAMLVARAGVP